MLPFVARSPASLHRAIRFLSGACIGRALVGHETARSTLGVVGRWNDRGAWLEHHLREGKQLPL